MRARSRSALFGAILAGTIGLAAGSAHAQQTFYSSSFEGTDGGWTGTNDWQRGVPALFTQTDPPCDNFAINPPASAGDGTECWGTNLVGCHNFSLTNSLTQTFNLAGWTSVRLKFLEWEDSGGNTFDMCTVHVNGTQVYLGDGAEQWTERDLDIASLADNNGSVTIEFRFLTTATVNRAGFYVDNVRIEGSSPQPGVNYALTVTDAPDPVFVGGSNVTYTCSVVNAGLDASTGGSFTAPLPAGCSFVSGSGASLSGPNIVATIPALAGGGVHNFSFELNPPDAAGTVTLNSSVTSNETDTDPSNNSRSNNTSVFDGVPGDDCEIAIDLNLQSFPYNVLIDNELAQNDIDPGTCNSITFGRAGIWFTYTAPASGGTLTFTETGTQDITWAVYANCGDPAPLSACTGTDTNQSRGLAPNETIKILVSASTATTLITTDLNLTFNFVPPPTNDVACDAEVIGSLPYSAISTNGAAALDDVDTGCNIAANTMTRRGLWFRYNATSTTGIIAAESSTNDTAMAVFTGPDCNNLTEVACNDDADGIGFSVVNGQTYWILVGMYSNTTVPTVPYTLSFSEVATPANDTCATAATIVSGGSSLVDARTAGSDSPVATCTPAATAFGTRHGVWYTFNTGADQGVLNVNETGTTTVLMQLFSGADCNSLTPVTCTATQNANFSLSPNTQYWLNIGISSPNDMPSATGSYNAAFTFTPVAGACCVSGNCELLTASACATAGGSFTGGPCSLPNASNTTVTFCPDYPAGGPATVVEIPVTVADVPGNVTSISVRVDLNFSFLGDLLLQLRAPDNTVVDLVGRVATTACPADGAIGNGDDLVGIYNFVDTATDTVRNYALTGPLVILPSGDYRAADCSGNPIDLNAAFASTPANGTWTLLASDHDEAITGSVNAWSISINGGLSVDCNTGPTPCELADFNDVDGVTADDIFAFLDAWFAQNGVCVSPATCTADINGVDDVTADDIFAFLDLWFTFNGTNPCP